MHCAERSQNVLLPTSYCRRIGFLRGIWAIAMIVTLGSIGCGRSVAPKDQPMRYGSIEKLRERLSQVAQYGMGGSSLGGIPESIEDLTKTDPERGKKLLACFQRLDTTPDKETRKKTANEMLELLK